jgi:peptidylprolyl isomerase/peptidyl-prolyl cis-trans isomerase C
MSLRPYYELKAAFALFGTSCDKLTEAESKRVGSVASHYMKLEAAVLASDEARGVCLAAGAVEAAIEEIRARHPGIEAYHASLAAAALDETALVEALARDLLVDAVMNRVGARAGTVDARAAEIFYHAHLDRFNIPERRAAHHILITINDDFPENRADEAQRRLHEIAARLAANPERFEEQAVKHSECPTALNGGLLGEVRRGQLFPTLDEALFQLRAGELSGVLRTELGVHLLRCDSIHPARTTPYAEVADKLIARLSAERGQTAAKRWLAGILNREGTPASNQSGSTNKCAQ